MLRDQEKRNMFTPPNRPEKGEYQFMDIQQIATVAGSQPVLVDQIFGKPVCRADRLCLSAARIYRRERWRNEVYGSARRAVGPTSHDRTTEHASHIRDYLVCANFCDVDPCR